MTSDDACAALGPADPTDPASLGTDTGAAPRQADGSTVMGM